MVGSLVRIGMFILLMEDGIILLSCSIIWISVQVCRMRYDLIKESDGCRWLKQSALCRLKEAASGSTRDNTVEAI